MVAVLVLLRSVRTPGFGPSLCLNLPINLLIYIIFNIISGVSGKCSERQVDRQWLISVYRIRLNLASRFTCLFLNLSVGSSVSSGSGQLTNGSRRGRQNNAGSRQDVAWPLFVPVASPGRSILDLLGQLQARDHQGLMSQSRGAGPADSPGIPEAGHSVLTAQLPNQHYQRFNLHATSTFWCFVSQNACGPVKTPTQCQACRRRTPIQLLGH